MNCSVCQRLRLWLIELLEDVQGVGPTKRQVCFSCLQKLGEKNYRKEQEQDGVQKG